jgi:two-component system, OmpR family, sensor kinase
VRSLRARATLATIAVAVIAVIVTGLISLQLLRSSINQEARAQLAAQADLVAALPRTSATVDLADEVSLALGGTKFALVRADGSIAGPASDYVDAAIGRRLAAGESVSVTRRGQFGIAAVEARPIITEGDRDGAIVLVLPIASIERTIGQSTGRILIALIIGLGVAVLGGALLARLFSAPLTATAAAARRLAAGERGVALPQSSTTEVADVAAALAALDDALAASEGRQREFLLSISHELRTPLTAVRGFAEAMADGLIAPSEIEGLGRTLVAESERLDGFVADLLALARLEADDFSIVVSRVDLEQLASEVASAWAGRAATLGVTVTAAGVGTVNSDPARLRQVIDGLVENAMRAGGSVEVRANGTADRANDGAVIEVVDTGPGLTDEDIAVAFERGVLRARYRDIRPVGTGLGLSIAARLIDRLGGTIAVANRREGGAAFTVHLNVNRDRALARQ